MTFDPSIAPSHIARFWAYTWTEDNAGPFVSRMDGQQIEAQLYGWDYAWWKGLTGEIRWDSIRPS